MSNKDKKNEPGRLTAWIQAKMQALKDWYHRDENFLRMVHFPGTNVPLLDVMIDFI